MCEETPNEIQILAKAQVIVAQEHSRHTINGFDFHIESYYLDRYVLNSEVALVTKSSCFQKGNQ